MSWIFQRGADLSTDVPPQYYVYRWWHFDVPRYVGKGTGRQWRSHLDGVLDRNPEKSKYFLQYGGEMSCEIVSEGISERAAHDLEAGLIGEHRRVSEGGTLLNMMRGSRAPQRTGRGIVVSKRLYLALCKMRPFAPNAVITVNPNAKPKRPGSGGRRNFDMYPPIGSSISVADHIRKVASENKAAGFPGDPEKGQHGHLSWDLSHRLISMTLPDGEEAPLGTTVATVEFLRDLEAQLDIPLDKRKF